MSAAKPASPKQIAFIKSLNVGRVIPTEAVGIYSQLLDRLDDVLSGKTIFIGEASDLISWMLELPKTAASLKPIAQVESEGVYVLPLSDGDNVIVKMKKSKYNRLYAMRLVEIGGRRLTEIGEIVNFDWQYAPDLTGLVRPEHKMTMEQAKTFGIRYGRCLRCSTKLTDAKSVERAIGPVCAKFFA